MICLQERFEIGKYLHLKIFLSPAPHLLAINPTVQVMWADEELGEDGVYRHGVRFVDPISEEVQRFKDFLRTFISPFSRIERDGGEVPLDSDKAPSNSTGCLFLSFYRPHHWKLLCLGKCVKYILKI